MSQVRLMVGTKSNRPQREKSDFLVDKRRPSKWGASTERDREREKYVRMVEAVSMEETWQNMIYSQLDALEDD